MRPLNMADNSVDMFSVCSSIDLMFDRMRDSRCDRLLLRASSLSHWVIWSLALRDCVSSVQKCPGCSVKRVKN
jgi:hypothetical protein